MAQLVEVLNQVIMAKEKEITLKNKELKDLKAKVPPASVPLVEVLKWVIKAKEKEITLKDKELKELKSKVP